MHEGSRAERFEDCVAEQSRVDAAPLDPEGNERDRRAIEGLTAIGVPIERMTAQQVRQAFSAGSVGLRMVGPIGIPLGATLFVLGIMSERHATDHLEPRN